MKTQWASALFDEVIPVLNQFKVYSTRMVEWPLYAEQKLLIFTLNLSEVDKPIGGRCVAPHQNWHQTTEKHTTAVAFEPTNILPLCIFSVHSLSKKLTSHDSIDVTVWSPSEKLAKIVVTKCTHEQIGNEWTKDMKQKWWRPKK